jgi:signal transduction histidine kinase
LSSLIRRHPNLETALIPLIAETDQTIRELRVIIFDLSRNEEANGLCGGILDLVRRSSRVLGFSPSVELCGPIETYSTDTINTELLAVLGEALSNIARHAQATAASITIEATSQVITLTISDNGIGIAPDAVHGEGLNNLSQRAKRLGATVTIGPGDTSGTQIQLRVPTNPTTQHEDDPTGAVSDRPNLLADDLG